MNRGELPAMEPVVMEVIRDVAIRSAIRLAVGDYLLRGPQGNILELESRVAWTAVITELEKEGYRLVPPGEYAMVYGLPTAEVNAMIDRDGTLFALAYMAASSAGLVVPLAEREEDGQLGPVPA